MLVQPGNRSVRSCVRASEAACARETMLFPWLGDFSERVLRGAARRRVPLLPRSRGFFAFGLGLCEDVQLSLTSVSVYRTR